MKEPSQLKKEVEKLFEKSARLLSDIHSTKQVLRLLNRKPWRSKGIIARQIGRELMITDAAVSGKVKTLLQQDLITSEKGKAYRDRKTGRSIHDGRARLLLLTEKGRMIADYLESFELPTRPRGKSRTTISAIDRSRAREFHSARLRELTERILVQLPDVHDANIYFPPFAHLTQGRPIEVRPKQVYHGLRLPFETEVLSDDLKNHLDFNEFRRFFKEFKRLCEEFEQRRDEALRGIEKDVSKHFNLQYSPHWEERDSFNWRMRGWIFEGGIQSIGEDREKYFEPYYVSFKSNVKEETIDGQKLLQYWIGGRGLIQSGGGNHKKEVFRKKIDDELSDYMRKIEKAPYYSDIKKAQSLLKRARDLRERIELALKRNLEVAIFRGDCEYTTAMD